MTTNFHDTVQVRSAALLPSEARIMLRYLKYTVKNPTSTHYENPDQKSLMNLAVMFAQRPDQRLEAHCVAATLGLFLDESLPAEFLAVATTQQYETAHVPITSNIVISRLCCAATLAADPTDTSRKQYSDIAVNSHPLNPLARDIQAHIAAQTLDDFRQDLREQADRSRAFLANT